MCVLREKSKFMVFFHTDVQFSHHYCCKDYLFVLITLLKINWPYKGLFKFHSLISMPTLIPITHGLILTLYYILKLGSVIPPIFFFFKSVLAIIDILFYKDQLVIYYIYKKPAKILRDCQIHRSIWKLPSYYCTFQSTKMKFQFLSAILSCFQCTSFVTFIPKYFIFCAVQNEIVPLMLFLDY